MAKGELLLVLGLLEVEGVSDMDLCSDLPPLLPPSSEPPVSPVLAMEEVCELSASPKSLEAHKCPPTL